MYTNIPQLLLLLHIIHFYKCCCYYHFYQDYYYYFYCDYCFYCYTFSTTIIRKTVFQSVKHSVWFVSNEIINNNIKLTQSQTGCHLPPLHLHCLSNTHHNAKHQMQTHILMCSKHFLANQQRHVCELGCKNHCALTWAPSTALLALPRLGGYSADYNCDLLSRNDG